LYSSADGEYFRGIMSTVSATVGTNSTNRNLFQRAWGWMVSNRPPENPPAPGTPTLLSIPNEIVIACEYPAWVTDANAEAVRKVLLEQGKLDRRDIADVQTAGELFNQNVDSIPTAIHLIPLETGNGTEAAFADGIWRKAPVGNAGATLPNTEAHRLDRPDDFFVIESADVSGATQRLILDADPVARSGPFDRWKDGWQQFQKLLRASRKGHRCGSKDIVVGEIRIFDSPLAVHLTDQGRDLRRLFGQCDAMANGYRNIRDADYRTRLLILLTAVICFVLFQQVVAMTGASGKWFWIIFASGAWSLLSITWLTLRHLRRPVDPIIRRYVDFRLLAEGIRVLFFWRLSGVTQNPAPLLDRWRVAKASWVARILGRLALKHPGSLFAQVDGNKDNAQIYSEWLQRQESYFERRIRDVGKPHQWFTLAKKWQLTITICTVGLKFAGTAGLTLLLNHLWPGQLPEAVFRSLIVVLFAVTAVFAYLFAIDKLFGIREVVARYTDLLRITREAKWKLSSRNPDLSPETIALVFGEESIDATAQWASLHHSRSMDPPTV
jgi:hypothetical protein